MSSDFARTAPAGLNYGDHASSSSVSPGSPSAEGLSIRGRGAGTKPDRRKPAPLSIAAEEMVDDVSLNGSGPLNFNGSGSLNGSGPLNFNGSGSLNGSGPLNIVKSPSTPNLNKRSSCSAAMHTPTTKRGSVDAGCGLQIGNATRRKSDSASKSAMGNLFGSVARRNSAAPSNNAAVRRTSMEFRGPPASGGPLTRSTSGPSSNAGMLNRTIGSNLGLGRSQTIANQAHAQAMRRRVCFCPTPSNTQHVVTPYARKYGQHPKFFEFNRKGQMELNDMGIADELRKQEERENLLNSIGDSPE